MMGGCELIMAARKAYPELPIIVTNGMIDTSAAPFVRLCVCFGVIRILAKPFAPVQLLTNRSPNRRASASNLIGRDQWSRCCQSW